MTLNLPVANLKGVLQPAKKYDTLKKAFDDVYKDLNEMVIPNGRPQQSSIPTRSENTQPGRGHQGFRTFVPAGLLRR
jgi:hypothetical protein